MQVFRASRNIESNQENCPKIDLLNLSEALQSLRKLPKFEFVILSAGETKLRDVEVSPEKTRLANHQSQVSLAKFFVESGCQKLIFLSSNRVFDGRAPSVSNFAEYSYATEYGRQKAEAEVELLKLGQVVRVVRLTKVLSEDNTLLKNWVSKLKLGQEIKAFVDVMVSPVTLDDTVRVITDVIESENESVTQFSATDEISYFDMARFVAKFLQVDVGLVAEQHAEEVGERSLDHASLECSKFRSVIPTSSTGALQKVLEKMISS